MTAPLPIVSGIERARALVAWKAVERGVRMVTMGVCELHRRQRGRCFLCPEPVEIPGADRLPRNHLRARTREHVFPRLCGGIERANVLLAHRECNEAKDARWPYPCEVIYLAAVYAAPHSAEVARFDRVANRAARRLRRLERIEANW